MTITHIVMFRFNTVATKEQISKVYDDMLRLKTACRREGTDESYIVSITGGTSNSKEGKEDGMHYAFTVLFADEKDRSYYLDKDPAHLEFVAGVKPLVDKVIVFDYNS
ncbi:stress responsive A/B barrel domain-containing protein [Xylariaceae sp. FL0594]|nr:stress responsive A/B barrel domain-containing protein [Xylariaceae sp. FL0594]